MVNITENYHIKGNTVAALGIFDGVHCGHRKIIKKAAEYSKSGLSLTVFTFNVESIGRKHSKRYEYIYSESQKNEILEKLGTDYIYSPVVRALCNMNGEDFVRKILCEKLNAKAVVCGKNFRFGKDALCGADELKEYGERLGLEVCVCEMEKIDGHEISSEVIRNFLKKGNVFMAEKLLGETYYINSEVVTGNRLGRTLNFPTINQLFKGRQLVPRKGVYHTFTIIDGKSYNSITNIGVKPTVEQNINPLAETHILDYNGNLYGQKIEVHFQAFIRDEKKFSSVEELKKQINEDIEYISKQKAGIKLSKPVRKD